MKPWEREYLADPIMQSDYNKEKKSVREHFLGTREGAWAFRREREAAVAAIKRIVAAGAFAALTLSLATGNASAEDYSKVEGYIHSFNNNVSVYSGVFALKKDVDLDTSVYFKYNIDLISPDTGGGDGGGGGGDDDEGEDDALIKSSGFRRIRASSAVSSAGGSSATDTRHALTLGASRNFNNIIGQRPTWITARNPITGRSPRPLRSKTSSRRTLPLRSVIRGTWTP